MIRQYIKPHPNTVPEKSIAVDKLDSLSIAQNQVKTKMGLVRAFYFFIRDRKT